MINKIKKIQMEKIEELLSLIRKGNYKNFTLKAPTGSGKTWMQGYLIQEIIKQDNNAVIIYQGLSKASLTRQSYDKIVKYSFSGINAHFINNDKYEEETLTIPKGYNVYFLSKDLLKKKGTLESQIIDLLKYKTKDKNKYLIIDESHIASNNIMNYKNFFSFIINFSATPNVKDINNNTIIELSEEICEDIQLIKKKKIYDYNDDIGIPERLEVALDRFSIIKSDYNDTNINPAMIIQISNKFKGEEQKNIITSILDKKGILWYYEDSKGFDSSDKISEFKNNPSCYKDKQIARKYITSNTSSVPIIIFKLTISEGFDIPRACYLLQIRETHSETLDEQVIGRIRRNPDLLNFENFSQFIKSKIMIAHIDGVCKQDTKSVNFVESKNQINIKTTQISNKKNSFDTAIIKRISESSKFDTIPKNIFDLKEKWDKIDSTFKSYFEINTLNEWVKFCTNYDSFKKEYIKSNDYLSSIIVNENGENIQKETFYRIDKYKTKIAKWIWKNKTSHDNIFSFESEAEMKIAEDLDGLLNSYDWGKNYFNGSKISYEYYIRKNGQLEIAKQYPDFFVKLNNKTFLIEVKSFIPTKESNVFDDEDYKNKVNSIKESYKMISSKINDYTFVVIILDKKPNPIWTSYVYCNGKEKIFYNSSRFDFFNN